jgi:hypothetical protein
MPYAVVREQWTCRKSARRNTRLSSCKLYSLETSGDPRSMRLAGTASMKRKRRCKRRSFVKTNMHEASATATQGDLPEAPARRRGIVLARMAVLHCLSYRRFCAIVTTLTWIAATKTTTPQEVGLTTTPPGKPVSAGDTFSP